MKEEGHKQLEMERNSMQVILKFPEKLHNEEHIKREVKKILSNILQDYLEKGSNL